MVTAAHMCADPTVDWAGHTAPKHTRKHKQYIRRVVLNTFAVRYICTPTCWPYACDEESGAPEERWVYSSLLKIIFCGQFIAVMHAHTQCPAAEAEISENNLKSIKIKLFALFLANVCVCVCLWDWEHFAMAAIITCGSNIVCIVVILNMVCATMDSNWMQTPYSSTLHTK